MKYDIVNEEGKLWLSTYSRKDRMKQKNIFLGHMPSKKYNKNENKLYYNNKKRFSKKVAVQKTTLCCLHRLWWA